MRAVSSGLVVFPPDLRGMLGAAALLRKLGSGHDLLALCPHEVARRLYGLSAEPELRQAYVVDLVPTDSVDTLLAPALERFAAAGVPVTWVDGDGELAALLAPVPSVGDRVDLWDGAGESWRRVAERNGDGAFIELANTIEAQAEGSGAAWRSVLEAVASSWDWNRVYATVTALAGLGAPSAEEQAWAAEQAAEVDRVLAALKDAPVHEIAGLTVALLHEPALAARVRPEAAQGSRTDVDVIGFVSGPGRLHLVATTPQTDLCVLQEIPGLLGSLSEGVVSGSITPSRAEFSWRPEVTLPAPLSTLMDAALAEQATAVGEEARIVRPPSERMAKGTDPLRLAPQDRELIREVLGSPTSDEEGDGSAPDSVDPASVKPDLHPPAHRTGVEIQPIPARS